MAEKCLRFFSVYGSDGKSLIFESDDEDSTVDGQVASLNDCMEAIEDGYVTIKLCAISRKARGKGGDKTEKQVYEFRVRANEQASQKNIGGLPGEAGSNMTLLNKIKELEIELVKSKHKQELDEIRREIAELKTASPVESMLPMLIQGLSGAGWGAPAAAIKGTPINGPDGPTSKDLVVEAIKRLSAIDKNLHQTLTDLADFAEKNPEKYFAYIPMLK